LATVGIYLCSIIP